ncbi:hypothetical protein V5799_031030 [Amblyomma americanum]|uniref:Uncharacterized protein n=1 Tax=Amblyomma americanum TaxID=6943 RepID=A0AAQ4ELD8_AMBAM
MRRLRAVGGTSIREISHATGSFIEHHWHLVALYVLAFLCVVISTASVLFFLLFRTESAPHLDACSTLSCKRALRDLERLIDVSIDPCHDFYGHVCRRWLRRSDGGFLETAAWDLLRDLNSSLNDVDEHHRVSPRLFNLAQFYQLCHRFLSARGLQLSDMLRPFNRYHDLLALPTFPEVIKRVVNLSLAQGVHTLLNIRLVRISNVTTRLRIGRGRSLANKCCENSTAELLVYLKSLVSGISTTLRKKQGNKILSLSANDIAEKDRFVHPLLAAPVNEQNYNVSVFGSLCKHVSSQEWLDALNAVLPSGSRLDRHSRVLVDNADAIAQALDFIGSSKDHGVAYIYIQVLMEAMRFDYLRRRRSHGPDGPARMCLRATWSALSGARDLVTSTFVGAHEKVARAIFERVLSSMVLDAEGSVWMGDLFRRNAKVMLGSVSIQSFAAASFNASATDESGVPNLTTSSALSLFPGLFMELREARQMRLLEDPPRQLAGKEGHDSDDFFESRVVYDVSSNSLKVPRAVRREPILYEEDVPLEFALGTLGMLMARELLRAVVPSNVPGLWTSQEQVAFLRYDQCVDSLARRAMNVSLERPPDNQAPEYFFWLQGARTAYDVLSASYAAEERRSSNWNSYWREAQRTFFRRLCLLSCRPHHSDLPSVPDDQSDSASQQPVVPPRVSCLLPLLNMPEFAAAFECGHTPPACTLA